MRKQDHVPNRLRVHQEHDQPIHSDSFSRGRRHTIFQGPQEIFVEKMGFFVTLGPGLNLLFKAAALVHGIRQLGERVGSLSAANIELKSIRYRGIFLVSSRQG